MVGLERDACWFGRSDAPWEFKTRNVDQFALLKDRLAVDSQLAEQQAEIA